MATPRLSFWTGAGRLVCAAILAASAGASPAMAQSDAAPEARSAAATLTKEEVTELSGLTVSARRTTALSELTVSATRCPPVKDRPDPDSTPPKLLSSYPARGATVRPGIVLLRLTFDKPMTCGGLLDQSGRYANPCPAPLKAPLFSRDRRTFLTICIVTPGPPTVAPPSTRLNDTTFINGAALGILPFGLRLEKFVSLSGQPLEPSNLDFLVDPNFRPVETMQEAMKQDNFLRNAQKAAERDQ